MENNTKKIFFIFLLIIIFVIIYFINKNDNTYNENFETDLIYPIKKIKPIISFNTDADIIFVSVYTPNIYNYAKHSIKNLLSYACKYDYGVTLA